jgi:hypothetical protein
MLGSSGGTGNRQIRRPRFHASDRNCGRVGEALKVFEPAGGDERSSRSEPRQNAGAKEPLAEEGSTARLNVDE